MKTQIVICHCEHKFQDGRYGVGKRLANVGNNYATCTVCKKQHPKHSR